MVACLTSLRFLQTADVLRQVAYDFASKNDPVEDLNEEYDFEQDPDSGEIIRRWKRPDTQDDLSTPDVDESKPESFRCIARGVIDGGIRVAGTTERFDEIYSNVDYVTITFPASTNISQRDQVTNIRDKRGNVLWREETIPNAPATVFNVTGVTPILDPFGNHIENRALLERASRQNGSEE